MNALCPRAWLIASGRRGGASRPAMVQVDRAVSLVAASAWSNWPGVASGRVEVVGRMFGLHSIVPTGVAYARPCHGAPGRRATMSCETRSKATCGWY